MTTSGTDISLSSLAAAAAVAASRDEDDEIIDERVREESDGKAPVVEKRSASGSEDDEADEDEEDEETNNKSDKSKSSNPKQQQQSSSNKARGATYDGNLCMICSDRASGFHYGVLACEGCKGFFKRVCKEQLKQVANGGNDELTSKDGQQQQSKRHCVFGGNCEINMRTRNRCQYCRIQKCLELGMSKDGIKLGRRSKKFKQNLSHVVAAAATPTQQPLVKQETSKTVPSSNKTATTKKSSPSPILNQEEPKQPQQQILAILPDNKFIIKAIDILSAVSAVAASASTTTTPVVANSSSPVATANQQQLVLANNLNILNNGHQTAGSNNLVNDSTVNASNVNSLTSAQLLAHQLVINNSNSNNTSSNNIKQQSDANNNSLKFVKIEQNGNLIDQNLNGGNVIVLSSQSSDQLKASISNGTTMCSGVAASSSAAANTANATQAPIIVLNSFNLATAPSNITNHNHNQLNPANLINSFVILNNNPNGEAIGNSSPQLQQQELQPMKQQKISIYSMLDKTQLNNIIEAITQAHKDTDTMYNHEPTLSALISSPSAATTSSAQQQQHQASELLRAVLERGLIALLTQTRLLDHINMLIEQAVLFAKNVPYFMNIHESDRIALLKSCVFDVICVRHATFFRTSLASRCSASLSSSSFTSSSPFSSSASSSSSDENNTSSSSIDLATLAACAVAASSTNHPHNGHQNQQLQLQGRLFIPLWNVWLNQETLTHSLPQLARFIAMLFDFYAYFNSIGPNDYELAIFSSYLLFNTDDQTLNDKEKLYSYHSLFHDIVLNEMLKSRSSELSREVNSSSSNSLCKPMSRDELELWMKTCCMKLKRLNQEHAKILMEQKQFIQFPDLYAELYNL